MVSAAYLFLSTLICAVSGYSYNGYLPNGVVPLRPRYKRVLVPAYKKVLVPAIPEIQPYKKVLVPASIPDFRPRVIKAAVPAANVIPFLAHLFIYKDEEVAVCSGSIISNRFVLTALHCLVDAAKKFNITEAEAQRRTVVKIGNREETEVYYVSKTYVAPINRPSDAYDDIVLLKLDRDIEFDFITTAPVAVSDDDLAVGDSLFVAAHGGVIVRGQEKHIPLTYDIANATVINTDWPDFTGFVTHNANRKFVDGDVGGPSFKLEVGKYLQVGIVSKGTLKQDEGSDDVFVSAYNVKIAPFCNFIKDVANVNCL